MSVNSTCRAIFTSAIFGALCPSAAAQWPPAVRCGLSTETPEEAVRVGDAAFVGKLQWYNVREKEGSGRVVPTHPIWGSYPTTSIEIGRFHQSDLSPYQTGGTIFEDSNGTFMFVMRGRGASSRILFMTPSYHWRNGRPLTFDMKLVREGEFSENTPALREKLIDAVVNPESSRLMWSYALRRLYRFEDDAWARFDFVLHPRIRSLPRMEDWMHPYSAGRLEYALDLLFGKLDVRDPEYQPPSSEDLRSLYSRLNEAFPTAPTPYMASAALNMFLDETTRKANFSLTQWLLIVRDLRQAVDWSEHAIHKTQAREAVNQSLEQLFGEPSLLLELPPEPEPAFDPNAPQPWPEVSSNYPETAVRLSDAAYPVVVEFYDDQEIDGIEIEVSARMIAGKTLWGRSPFEVMEMQRSIFALSLGMSGRRGASLLSDFVHPGRDAQPKTVVLLSGGKEAELRILYVVSAKDGSANPGRDILRLRELELAPDSERLRDQLIQTVTDRNSSPLLWRFALRRLYRMADDFDGRFKLLLHPRIQKNAPDPRTAPRFPGGNRIAYAFDLLARVDYARMEDWFKPVPPNHEQMFFTSMLTAFEDAPSPYMAEATIGRLAYSTVRDEFTPNDWESVRRRIRQVIDNPDHAIHKISPEARERVNKSLERILGESKILGAESPLDAKAED